MNKTDMMTVYQGMEYKLIKQQEENIARTGMADEALTEKIQLIQAKIADCPVLNYGKIIEDDKSFMSERLAKYGIMI